MAAPRGTVIRQQHYPGRAPLDAYGNGGFRFAGMSHRGSILCLPGGIHGWAVTSPAELDLAAFEKLFADPGRIDILLIGMGKGPAPIPAPLRAAFRERNISSDSMSTGAAVRTFNVLLAEDRAVAAALIAVD
ncbi:MAG: Mth938-like domain-containing protein [Bauldia sp.]|nr:Mth938-like domain-containing protein [Bauldia sp.]